ncbi:hypothetical protein K501DRAFT_333962 [Backusella circina FSU 941]|nr:hypothetical protein K501DRAFT_333962 [Backusella circina FSU 941]
MTDCGHEVKFNGLCAICGQVVEDDEKNNINMSHGSTGITVTRTEAERIEEEDEQRLLKSRKLSLIVDLDQTVLHATWEPTMNEWVKDSRKDIRHFTLPGSSHVYHIKLRPGLEDFLLEMSKIYEMHIYTMGTRTYAEAVVNEIDPKGKLFNDRILSRDDSGSMTQKRLERLFPSNTSKVVILDDRADVWSFSPNLIQIKPYEYFVGIGDINSPFLPKGKKEEISTSEQVKSDDDELNNQDKVSDENTSQSNTLEQHKEQEQHEPDHQVDTSDENTTQSNQVETDESGLPIQDKVNDADDEEKSMPETQSDTDDNIPPPVASLTEQQQMDPSDVPRAPGTEEPLTNPGTAGVTEQARVDKDTILPIMARALRDVHDEFYKEIDLGNQKPDVAEIIPQLKSKVLAGTHFVFSGVIPLHQAPQNSLIWKTATTFGAECGLELTGKVTHLIAASTGTSKVNAARKYKKIHIVTPDWLTESTARWEIQPEEQYQLQMLSPAPSEVDNPESTALEFEDVGGYEPEVGAVLDWNEADKEVDDLLGEVDSDEESINSLKRKDREEDDDSEEDKYNPHKKQKSIHEDDDDDEDETEEDWDFSKELDNVLDDIDSDNEESSFY